MSTPIPDRALLIMHHIMEWESANNEDLFSSDIFDQQDLLLMFFRVMEGLKINSPPDIVAAPADWDDFVIDIYLTFGQDFGISNIKSIIKNQDRNDINDDVETTATTVDPADWPLSDFVWHRNILNIITTPE